MVYILSGIYHVLSDTRLKERIVTTNYEPNLYRHRQVSVVFDSAPLVEYSRQLLELPGTRSDRLVRGVASSLLNYYLSEVLCYNASGWVDANVGKTLNSKAGGRLDYWLGRLLPLPRVHGDVWFSVLDPDQNTFVVKLSGDISVVGVP